MRHERDSFGYTDCTATFIGKGKGKANPRTAHEGPDWE